MSAADSHCQFVFAYCFECLRGSLESPRVSRNGTLAMAAHMTSTILAPWMVAVATPSRTITYKRAASLG